MRALTNFDNGVHVMIEINRIILNPVFLGCFFISGVGSFCLFFISTGLLAYAGIVFFVGTVVVTVAFNVPLNNKLKDSSEHQKSAVWHEYLSKWVIWNHVRTLCGIFSSLLLCI